MLRKSILIIAAMLLMGGLSSAWGADGVSVQQLTAKNVDFFTAYCPVMVLQTQQQQMTACEKVIKLVDRVDGGLRLRTMLRDASGNTVPFSRFRKGQMVFIRGLKQSDGTILARGIYLMPANLSTTALNSYSFVSRVPDWQAEVVSK